MRVWRVEHRDGYGPYRFRPNNKKADSLSLRLGNAHGWDYDPETGEDRHPGPHGDGLSNIIVSRDGMDYLFGCPSRETLAEWFEGFGEDLHDAGYTVTVWDVVEAHVGTSGRQVMYDGDAAVLVDLLDVREVIR